MDYQQKGTELQVRELIRRAQYLSSDIYSNNKPLPLIPKPSWFAGVFGQLTVQLVRLDLTKLAVENALNVHQYKVNLILSNLVNRAGEYQTLNLSIELIEESGKYVYWTVADAERFLKRASIGVQPILMSVIIQEGRHFAGRWNSARSSKLQNAFTATDSAAVALKAQGLRAKAAMIVNDTSSRAADYIQQAQNLEATNLFQTEIEANNF